MEPHLLGLAVGMGHLDAELDELVRLEQELRSVGGTPSRLSTPGGDGAARRRSGRAGAARSPPPSRVPPP